METGIGVMFEFRIPFKNESCITYWKCHRANPKCPSPLPSASSFPIPALTGHELRSCGPLADANLRTLVRSNVPLSYVSVDAAISILRECEVDATVGYVVDAFQHDDSD